MLVDRVKTGGRIFTVALTAAVSASAAQERSPAAPQCRPGSPPARISELPEASGIAASRRHPGIAWAHNDSGEPVLFALNESGAAIGRVRLTGATVEDWEAIAVGPCPAGSCIYVGDIGDNEAERKHITIYRLPEPAPSATAAAVQDVFRATYPDGAQDAEALLVSSKGEIFIVTKGESGPVALYRVSPKAGSSSALERVGEPRGGGKSSSEDRITDGAVSPRGAWAVLRTTRALHFYATADLLAGSWREAGRVNLASLSEPQGEGVTFADDGTLFLVSEGGGKSQPGTFARLACTFTNENSGR